MRRYSGAMRRLICLLVLLATPLYAQERDALKLAESARAWQQKADESSAQAAKIERTLKLAADQRARAEQRGSQLRGQLSRLKARERSVLDQLQHDRGQLNHLLAALMRLGVQPAPALVVSPTNALEAARAARLMASITPTLKARASVLQTEIAALKTVRARITGVRANLDETDAETARLRMAEQDKRRLAEVYRARAAKAVEAARALAPNSAELEDVLARLNTNPADDDADIQKLRGKLPLPALAAGVQRVRRPTPYLLLDLPASTMLNSPVAGRVTHVGPLKGYGGVLLLDIGGGYHLLLMGVNRVFVAEGDIVQAGDVLAQTAPEQAGQVRLDLRHRTQAIDPAKWFDLSDVATVTNP
jgi:septal ring factor EnvC (AmiA/AmiB activator)